MEQDIIAKRSAVECAASVAPSISAGTLPSEAILFFDEDIVRIVEITSVLVHIYTPVMMENKVNILHQKRGGTPWNWA